MQTQDEQKKLISDFIVFLSEVYDGKFWPNHDFYFNAFTKWKSERSLSECERQPVGNNEQGGNNFNCLGVIKGLSDNECSSYCGNEYCNGY